MSDSDTQKPRLVGINHVALEVGDIDEAESFYGDVFAFEIRGRTDSGLFLDMGDQFLALSETDDTEQTTDDHRHLGLVVDDTEAVERRLETLDIDVLPGRGLDFRDPWGNRLQLVSYSDIQFTKADHVLEGMDLSRLEKTDSALEELAEKGIEPDRG
jgi:catechol 2,3-dioxygenase-like lactoylglutathione lyase family enzyme